MNKKLIIKRFPIISTRTFRLLVSSTFFVAVLEKPVTAVEFSINSGQSCSSRGQIRDFQAQRFICLKVNAKAGSSKGPSLVWVKISYPKSTTKSTTTTVKIPSTTVKKTCQDGGTCKIGDRGPGGGVIFYVDGINKNSNWNYLELAPTFAAARSANNTDGGVSWSEASVVAAGYRTDSADDWFLPNYWQLSTAIKNLFYIPLDPLAWSECATLNDYKDQSKCGFMWTSTLRGESAAHIQRPELIEIYEGQGFDSTGKWRQGTPTGTGKKFFSGIPETPFWATEKYAKLAVRAVRGFNSDLANTSVTTNDSKTTTSTISSGKP